jgi:ABC-type transport system involved in multi-copper enzyme maturation permease subunit
VKGIRSLFIPNPILVKELRSRMRGPRAFITLTIALVIMAGLMIALVSLLTATASQFGSNLLSPQIGQILFAALLIFEMLLVCTVTPAVTAGAISTEREKQTFEMLQATPLGSVRLLWGKLISALSYVFLMIFAAVPLASIVFLFGGVTILQLLKGLLVLVVTAVTLGVYGLFLSTWLGRTGRATVVGFISVMVLIAGPLAGVIVMALFGGRVNGNPILLPRPLLAISPLSMLSSAIAATSSVNSGGIDSVLNFIAGQWDPSMDPTALTQFPRPIYHYSLLICGVVTIVLFLLTVALLHPSRRFFLPVRLGLTGGAVLVVFLALMTGAFLITAPRYEWVKAAAETPIPPITLPAKAVPPLPAIAYPAIATSDPANSSPYPALGEPGPTPAPTSTGAAPGLSPTSTATTSLGTGLPLEEQIAIYAAAARQIYQKDNTMESSAPHFAVIYLISITNDRTGDPNQPDNGPASLQPDLRKGLVSALSDLPASITWVTTLDEIPKDGKSGTIQDGGMAITFGNIQIQPDGSVQLPASVYISSLMAGGQTYVLEKVKGEWQVTGITGTQWIS